MHELAICQALIDQVTTIACTHRAVGVSHIHIAIGSLAGVEPHLLEQAFAIAKAGGIAATALLVITHVPLLVHCPQCGKTTEALPSNLVCGHCGDWHSTLVSGDELLLSRVELVL